MCPSPVSPDFATTVPQMLFGARLIADILGRVSPKPQAVQSPYRLLFLSVVRVAITPLFIMYILNPSIAPPAAAVLYVAIFWWSSGYINT